MDALEIDRAILAGFDWGARTADIVAALWPERCTGLVAVSGYLIGSQAGRPPPLPPEAELQWWYQYYFATERGRAGYDENRHDSRDSSGGPPRRRWDFDDATFERSAASFDNPDHVQHRDPQLSVAAGTGRRRPAVRRPGGTARCRRRSSRYRRSLWKATPTARRIRLRVRMRSGSPARTSTGTSRAVSGTTFPRRLPKPSRKLSWTSRRADQGAVTRVGSRA